MKNTNKKIQMQAAYKNAVDCLYYGYGKSYWNCCGLDKKTADEVWIQAKRKITSLQ